MANYCFSSYVVEGKRETLEHIKDVINTVAKRYEEEKNYNCNLSDILIGLGLYTEETLKEATKDYTEDTPEGLGIAGDWRDAEVKELNGSTVLTFREEYKWNCSCDMETLSQLDAFKDSITGVYRYSEEEGCGIYETTDCGRKYFNAEYLKSLGYEPEEIVEASGMTAGQYHKIAEQIIEQNFKSK